MTKRIVDESLLKQVLTAFEVATTHTNADRQEILRAIAALRSALDGDAVEPVTMRLEVDTKNVVATIDKIRNDLIGEGLEEPFAADCCPYCEALIHPAPQPTQKE